MKIRDSGFFVARTPLLSWDVALRWSESLCCAELLRTHADAETLEDAWRDDVAVLRARLAAYIAEPAIIQALAVASPSLYRALGVWNEIPDGKKGLQAERALTRYFMRMTGRSTPFGLFSGCSAGTVRADEPTQIILSPRSQYLTVTRLDFNHVVALTAALRDNQMIWKECLFDANSSLSRSLDGWRYIECQRVDNTCVTHQHVKLEADIHLDSVIAAVRDRGCTLDQLTNLIHSLGGSKEISSSEIIEYLEALVENDILIPRIVPQLTGSGTLDALLNDLRPIEAAASAYAKLNRIKDVMRDFDARPLAVDGEEYMELAERVRALPGIVNSEQVVHVDMFKPVTVANLGADVIAETINAIKVVCGCFASKESPALTAFRKNFVTRYENSLVPLAEALDPETGVGYGGSRQLAESPLLDGLAVGGVPREEDEVRLNALQTLLLQKIVDSTGGAVHEVELSHSALPKSVNIEEALPESFSVLISLLSENPDALRNGDFRIIYKGGQGPSCARTLARFCQSDSKLERLVRGALRKEEENEPKDIFAEVVYQPEGRTGNVTCRPVLREYEIPFLGRSGAAQEKQLSIADLLVGVENGNITLYSRKLHRRVHPRLSTAHNYAHASMPPVYRFLCELQNQGGLDVPSFRWGALSKLSRLPRVRLGRVILSRAQWRFTASDITTLGGLDGYRGFVRLKELQREREIPRWVMVSEYDHMLPMDLDNPLCVDSLLQLLKRVKEAVLVEIDVSGCAGSVVGPEGAFQHELIIPFHIERSEDTGSAHERKSRRFITTDSRTLRAKRFVAPGGDWHYLKIYSGCSSADEILIKDLGPLMSRLQTSGAVTKWFFVRYADPEAHLRLRFQSTDLKTRDLLSQAAKEILEDGRAWKIQWDTYQREIERYGGTLGVSASEELFCADSTAVLEILTCCESQLPDMRWKSAMIGIDRCLGDFAIHIQDRLHLCNRMRRAFAEEFLIDDVGKQKIGLRFREQRSAVENLLDGTQHLKDKRYTKVRKALERRSRSAKRSIDQLKDLEQKGELSAPLADIVISHIHMSINRMMKAQSREHEFVLYEFLHRLYEGQLARNRCSL